MTFWNLYVPQKWSSGQIECSYYNSAENLLVPRWKNFTQTPKLIINLQNKFKKASSTKCSHGQPKSNCSFKNPAGNFLPEFRQFSAQSRKTFLKLQVLLHMFPKKDPLDKRNAILTNLPKHFCRQADICQFTVRKKAGFENLFRDFFVSKTFILTGRVLVWHLCRKKPTEVQKHFTQSPKSIPKMYASQKKFSLSKWSPGHLEKSNQHPA